MATTTSEALARHYDEIAEVHLRDLFTVDPDRGTRFTADGAGIHLDCSKSRITDDTVRLLGKALAKRIVPELTSDAALGHDSSTNALIARYRAAKTRKD